MLAEEAAAAIVVVAGGSSLAGLEQRDLLHDVPASRCADAVTAREGQGLKAGYLRALTCKRGLIYTHSPNSREAHSPAQVPSSERTPTEQKSEWNTTGAYGGGAGWSDHPPPPP